MNTSLLTVTNRLQGFTVVQNLAVWSSISTHILCFSHQFGGFVHRYYIDEAILNLEILSEEISCYAIISFLNFLAF